MGGFPLLSNQLIAEGGKAPDIPDPTQQMAELTRLRQAQANLALAPLQKQELQGQINRTDLSNQESDKDLQERQKFGQAIVDSGGDPDKFLENAYKTITNPALLTRAESAAAQMKAKQATITARQHDDAAKQADLYAGRLQSILDESDPTRKLGLWTQTVNSAMAMKGENNQPLLPPNMFDPNSLPDDKAITTLQNYLDANGTFHAKQAKLKDEADKSQKAADDSAKADRENRAGLSQDAYHSSLQIETPQDYAAWRSGLDPKIQGNYPATLVSPKRTQGQTMELIRRTALNAEQASQLDMTASEHDRQDREDEEKKRHDLSVEAVEAARAARERGQTENSKAVDRRELMTGLTKSKAAESQLRTQLSNLENAINSNGKTYVNEKGVTMSMDKAKGQDVENDTAENLTQRMRSSYQDTVNRLKAAVEDKNNFGEALGMKIGVPTADIHSALDSDVQRVLGPKQPAAATPAASIPQPVAQPTPAPLPQPPIGQPVPSQQPPAVTARPAQAQVPPQNTPQADPTIKQMKGYVVGQKYKTKDGRTITIKGFSKDGQVIY